MTIHQIALPQGDPHFEQQVQLDGLTYNLLIHWNEREEAFYMELLDDDNEPIVSGRKMVADWPMLHRSVDARLPAGELLVVDITGNGVDPGLYDLDKRVVLMYFDADSMAEIT